MTHLGGDCNVAIDVTGNAFEVYDALLPHAGNVVVANPLEVRRLGSGRHTDRVDAVRLAKTLALGTIPEAWVPPQPTRHIRRLLKARERLLSTRTALINQARAVLRRQGLNSDVGLETSERGDLAEALPFEERILLMTALSQRDSAQVAMSAPEAELARRLEGDTRFRHLLTITGIGLTAAAALWAHIGDPTRLKTPKEVGRYVGLDPTAMQSGQVDRTGRISKNGPSLLRTLLVEAAYSLGRHDRGEHLCGAATRRNEHPNASSPSSTGGFCSSQSS